VGCVSEIFKKIPYFRAVGAAKQAGEGAAIEANSKIGFIS